MGVEQRSHEEVQALIVEHLARVPAIARRVARRYCLVVDHDELVQGGVLGLIDAARRYDPSRGCGFASYSEIRIRGAVLDQLRALDWLPRSMRRAERAFERGLHAVQQREPASSRAEEVLDSLGLAPDAMLRRTVEPFDEDAPSMLGSSLDVENPLAALCAGRTRHAVEQALAALPEAERGVVVLLYWTDLGVEEVAHALAADSSRIRGLHARALQRLRVQLRELFE